VVFLLMRRDFSLGVRLLTDTSPKYSTNAWREPLLFKSQ
jgi:hypothetical protein